MAYVALREAPILAQPPRLRRLLRVFAERVDLGDPAPYLAPGGVRWLVFDLVVVKADDLRRLGKIMSLNAAQRTAIQALLSDDEEDLASIRIKIRDWLATRIDRSLPPDDGDQLMHYITANGASANNVQVMSGLPDDWVPA